MCLDSGWCYGNGVSALKISYPAVSIRIVYRRRYYSFAFKCLKLWFFVVFSFSSITLKFTFFSFFFFFHLIMSEFGTLFNSLFLLLKLSMGSWQKLVYTKPKQNPVKASNIDTLRQKLFCWLIDSKTLFGFMKNFFRLSRIFFLFEFYGVA